MEFSNGFKSFIRSDSVGFLSPHVIARHLVQQCTSYGLSEFVGHVFKVLLGKETVLIVL